MLAGVGQQEMHNSIRLTITCDAELDDDENGKHDVDNGNQSKSHVGQCLSANDLVLRFKNLRVLLLRGC